MSPSGHFRAYNFNNWEVRDPAFEMMTQISTNYKRPYFMCNVLEACVII